MVYWCLFQVQYWLVWFHLGTSRHSQQTVQFFHFLNDFPMVFHVFFGNLTSWIHSEASYHDCDDSGVWKLTLTVSVELRKTLPWSWSIQLVDTFDCFLKKNTPGWELYMIQKAIRSQVPCKSFLEFLDLSVVQIPSCHRFTKSCSKVSDDSLPPMTTAPA